MNITRQSRRTLWLERPWAATSWILLPLGAALLSSCSRPAANQASVPVSTTAPSTAATTPAAASPTVQPGAPVVAGAAPVAKPSASGTKVPVGNPVASAHLSAKLPPPQPLLAPNSRYLPPDEKAAGWRLSYALANKTHTGQRLELHMERLQGALTLADFSWKLGAPIVEKTQSGQQTDVKVTQFSAKPDGSDRAVIVVEVIAPAGPKPQSVSFMIPVIAIGHASAVVQVNAFN